MFSAVPRMGNGHGRAGHERAVRADQEEGVALGVVVGHNHTKVRCMSPLRDRWWEASRYFFLIRPTTDSSTTSVDKPDSTATAPPSTSLYRAPRPSARQQQRRPGTAPPSTLTARDSKASSQRTEPASQSVARHRIGEGKAAPVAPSRSVHPPQVKRNRRPQSQCRSQRNWMRPWIMFP